MEWRLILLMGFAMVTPCLMTASASVTEFTTMAEDSSFVNQTVIGNVPTICNVTSAIACFHQCLGYGTCQTIFYHYSLSTCVLCPRPCAYNLTWSPGYRCFRSEKIPACPHPPDIMFAEPTYAIGYSGDSVSYWCSAGANKTGAANGTRTCNRAQQWVLTSGSSNPVCEDTFEIGDWIRIKMTSATTAHMEGKTLFQGVIGIVTNGTSSSPQLSFPWTECGLTPGSKLERVPESHSLMTTSCNTTSSCVVYPNTICHRNRCVCKRYFIFSDVLGRCV